MSHTRHIESLIAKRLPGKIISTTTSSDFEERILVSKHHLTSLIRFLKNDPDILMDLLLDLSCIEHQSSGDEPSLEVFYILRSTKLGYRLRISILLDEQDESLPSLSLLFLSALWLERELWDMFGIYTEGHPALKRLIMYTGFSGHPLRKTYPIGKEQALVPIYRG
jgi:NADH-quinone oxidoreductase subunit C